LETICLDYPVNNKIVQGQTTTIKGDIHGHHEYPLDNTGTYYIVLPVIKIFDFYKHENKCQ
jgi:hypothetical protein